MYVTNPKAIKNAYTCKKIIADYLVQKGFLVLGKENSLYYFSKTKLLDKAISEIPFWMKISL